MSSRSSTGELQRSTTVCTDGTEAALLDIVAIEFRVPRPHDYQTENHVIVTPSAWTKAGVAGWSDLAAIASRAPGSLWTNGDSTRNGINDQIELTEAKKFDYSLVLVAASSLSFLVHDEGFQNTKMRVRCTFDHAGVRYKFMLTDVPLENDLIARGSGLYATPGPVYLCVSLSEPFQPGSSTKSFCYKLVAGVILAPGASL